jgi:hypothetical protein
MIQTYARWQDANGVQGPLVRFGAPIKDLTLAKKRATKALTRGAIEVEVRSNAQGKEFYLGTMTCHTTLFVEDVWHVQM